MYRLAIWTAAVTVCLFTAVPASAELVFFESGRTMSVKAIRSEGDDVVLQLRSGGEMRCDKKLLARVEPDEVEYPKETLADAPEAITQAERPISGEYSDLIVNAAARYGVDARIVDAVVQVESAYDSRA